jgi:hypothetical protein
MEKILTFEEWKSKYITISQTALDNLLEIHEQTKEDVENTLKESLEQMYKEYLKILSNPKD